MKVLVVDDSMIMRKIIINALAELQVAPGDVTQAEDGSEGVKAAAAGSFDIILMDWNMPKTNGLEALKTIRATGNKTPVIMVTTEGEKSAVIQAVQSGANNYLVKPFQPADLVEKVKQVISG